MANRKISDLTALTAPATGDLLPIVDISEAAAADKNKKITFGELFASIPAGTAAAPSIAFEGDSNTGIYSPGADQLAISTNGTGRLFVDASGRLLVGTSTATANGGVLQVSNGITFPATAVACTDANTLDDYEEGTWTPSLGGTATYATQAGQYTKVGRLVYISLQLDITSIGTGSASRISGIPFNDVFSGQNLTVGALNAASSTTNFITGRLISNLIRIYGNSAPGTSITEINIFQNGTQFYASGYYAI